LKILLSAYACEPNTGSEHEIGWSWIKSLSKKNKIYVLTRTSNKKKILKETKNNKIKNVIFLYYDLPCFLIKIIKRGKDKPNSYLYFFLWQIFIYFRYKDFIISNKFDFIHHVTFGSFRIPSLLSLCKVPFIYGPIGGGESVPIQILKKFSIKSLFIELIRVLSNSYIKFSLLANVSFFKSKKIILTSYTNKKIIPSFYHKKISIVPGVFNEKIFYKIKKNKNFRLCFIGRLVEWKGVELLKQIFLKAKAFNNKITLDIYGDGPRRKSFQNFIINNDLKNKIKLCGQMDQNKMIKVLKKYDLLIFPTLRDSGGYVIIEALNNGLNVITTNAAGPEALIKNCDIGLVNIYNNTFDQIVGQFYKKIKFYYNDQNKKIHRYELNKLLTSKNKINSIYNL